MHTYTLPVQRMEYASTVHGKHLYHTWNTPVLCMEYTSTSWNTAQGFPKFAKTCSHLPMILLANAGLKSRKQEQKWLLSPGT